MHGKRFCISDCPYLYHWTAAYWDKIPDIYISHNTEMQLRRVTETFIDMCYLIAKGSIGFMVLFWQNQNDRIIVKKSQLGPVLSQDNNRKRNKPCELGWTAHVYNLELLAF